MRLISKDEKAVKHPYIHHSLILRFLHLSVMYLQKTKKQSRPVKPACAAMPGGNESLFSFVFLA